MPSLRPWIGLLVAFGCKSSPSKGVADGGPIDAAVVPDALVADVPAIPVDDGGPMGRISIAGPGELLLDVSPDGKDALLVDVTSGDLSIVPLSGSGSPVAVGSLGAPPASTNPNFSTAALGTFLVGATGEVFVAEWVAFPEPIWIGSRTTPATQLVAQGTGWAASPNGDQLVVAESVESDAGQAFRLDAFAATPPFALQASADAGSEVDLIGFGSGGSFVGITDTSRLWSLGASGFTSVGVNDAPVSAAYVVGDALVVVSRNDSLFSYPLGAGFGQGTSCGVGLADVTGDGARIIFQMQEPLPPGCTSTRQPGGTYLWDPNGTDDAVLLLGGKSLLDPIASASGRYVEGDEGWFDTQAAAPTTPIARLVCPGSGCTQVAGLTTVGPGEQFGVYATRTTNAAEYVAVALPSGRQVSLPPTILFTNRIFLAPDRLLLGGTRQTNQSGTTLFVNDLTAGTSVVVDEDVANVVRVGTTGTIAYTKGSDATPTGVYVIAP